MRTDLDIIKKKSVRNCVFGECLYRGCISFPFVLLTERPVRYPHDGRSVAPRHNSLFALVVDTERDD